MNLAILGAGNIANSMAQAAQGTEGVTLYAVASRDLSRSEAFAQKWGFEKAYGSYEEMVSDENVDLVYVATPHSHHYQHMKLCLAHGKHVLCEKAFTRNAKEAREILKEAEEKNLLVTEAIWTRYMPSRKMISDLLQSGVIGKPYALSANLGYAIADVPRIKEPELAGGALLDLGVYTLNFAAMIFGTDIVKTSSAAMLSDRGVDLQHGITLIYRDGSMASLYSTAFAQTDRRGIIVGDQGVMEIKNINNCEEIRIYNLNRECTAVYPVPEQINGYEYELMACRDAIAEGRIECGEMPHAETIRIMEQMDALRAEWGMVYPGE